MRVESATNAKNNFGAIMDAAMREPVIIQKSGRNAVVMMSYEEYEEKERDSDHFWGMMALEAEKEEPIGVEESEKLLASIMNAED